MKKSKYIIIISFLLLISITCFYLFIPKNISHNNIQNEKEAKEISLENEDLKDRSQTKEISEVKNTNVDINLNLVTLNVLDKSYNVKVKEGSSVLEVMETAERDGLSFKGKNYESMGYFVEEINGVSNSPKGYWLYYVNNQQAEVGISKYIIKEGDIINWRLE